MKVIQAVSGWTITTYEHLFLGLKKIKTNVFWAWENMKEMQMCTVG